MSNYSDNTFTRSNPPVLQDPSRWVAQWDDQYNRFYYVDLQNNNQAQWDPPAGTTVGQQQNTQLQNTQQQTYQQQTYQQQSNTTGTTADDRGMFSSFTNTNTASSGSSKGHMGTMLGAGAGVLGGLLLGNTLKNHRHGHNGHNPHHNGGGFGGEGRHGGPPGFGGFGGFGGHGGHGGHGGPGGPGGQGGFGGFGGGPGGPGGRG
jgi:hypothetical protein